MNKSLNKNQLRKITKQKLKKLTQTQILIRSKKISQKLLNLELVKSTFKIGLYFSKEHEVQTKNIILELLKNKKEIYLPKIHRTMLIFKRIESLNDLVIGPFNILEPKSSLPSIEPSKLDLLITPCVAIDIKGNRIGHGKGFYDKYITKYKKTTICLAFESQLYPQINPGTFDQKIDFILTEKRIINSTDFKLLDGKKLANKIFDKIKEKIETQDIKPTLSVILVGSNPASENYIKIKHKKCAYVGIKFDLIKFSEKTSEKEIISKINNLNKDPQISGIIIQLPLPKELNTQKIINKVSPDKDVDGLTIQNRKNFLKNKKHFKSCAPQAILELLHNNKISLKNKKIVIIGNGYLIGKPLSLILKKRKINFKICTRKTNDLKAVTLQADIIITATGKPNLIGKNHIKNGAIIIDAGTTNFNNTIVGDVDFNQVAPKCSWITPTPGGVGPVTVAILIKNTYKAWLFQKKFNI